MMTIDALNLFAASCHFHRHQRYILKRSIIRQYLITIIFPSMFISSYFCAYIKSRVNSSGSRFYAIQLGIPQGKQCLTYPRTWMKIILRTYSAVTILCNPPYKTCCKIERPLFLRRIPADFPQTSQLVFLADQLKKHVTVVYSSSPKCREKSEERL